MSEKRKPRLTKQQRKVLTRMKAGETLMLTVIDGERYLFEGGESVDLRVVKNLINAGMIIPNEDGFFWGCAQTWRVKE